MILYKVKLIKLGNGEEVIGFVPETREKIWKSPFSAQKMIGDLYLPLFPVGSVLAVEICFEGGN
jgi:hypothetical protein